MEIEIKNNRPTKNFGDLKAGDVFQYCDNTYIKVNAPTHRSLVNAIALPSFVLTHHADCTPVIPRKARLIIDD
jgi:hypothetical protein